MHPYQATYHRYYRILFSALDQLDGEAMFVIPQTGCPSIAVLLKHLAGNLNSRFTDFLTTDGEKSWRQRDTEFVVDDETRESLIQKFDAAFAVLIEMLDSLTEADRTRIIKIRGRDLTVEEALARSLTHFAYHVGEIVLLAHLQLGERWQSLSIPLGQSEQFNQSLGYLPADE